MMNLFLIGMAKLSMLIEQKTKTDIPVLQAELENACTVYESVKNGFSYSSARKSRPSVATNDIFKDIAAIAADFQEVLLV
jgi:hypothetical protein